VRTKVFQPQIRLAMPDRWSVEESYSLISDDSPANVLVSTGVVARTTDAQKLAEDQREVLAEELRAYEEYEFRREVLLPSRTCVRHGHRRVRTAGVCGLPDSRAGSPRRRQM
jgi:hypothetical protein